MSRRFDFYFKQPVTEIELDDAFEGLELADRQLIADQGFYGLFSGGALAAHEHVPDLTVDMSGPLYGYDANGQRIFVPGPTFNINLAQDSNGVSTGVQGALHEKWISIFVRFKRALSDQRVDGNAATIYYQRDESYELVVVQGAEANVGVAVKPSLVTGSLLIGDVRLVFGQSQIQLADINVTRRQDTVVMAAPPGGMSLRSGTVLGAVQAMLTALNNHILLPGGAHPASAIAAQAVTATTFSTFSTVAGTLQNVLSQIVEGIDAVTYTAASIASNLATLAGVVDSPTYEADSLTHWKPLAIAQLDATAEMNFNPAAILKLPAAPQFADGTYTFTRIHDDPPLYFTSEFAWTQVDVGIYRLVQTSALGTAAYRLRVPAGGKLQSVKVFVKGGAGHSALPGAGEKLRAQVSVTRANADIVTLGSIVENDATTIPEYQGVRIIQIDGANLPAGATSADPLVPSYYTYELALYGEYGTAFHAGGRILSVIYTWTTTTLNFATT